jgi:hypothetical protein
MMNFTPLGIDRDPILAQSNPGLGVGGPFDADDNVQGFTP